MKWPMVKLGDVVDIKGGGTPSKDTPEYWGGDIPWVSVKDFKSSLIDTASEFITTLGLEKSATNLIPRGTIVVPTRMAVGKVALLCADMAINQDLKALLIKNDEVLDKRFLLRFLESSADRILKFAKGATVKGITLDVLKDLDVPLPPLEEQKRIAAILDKADAIRRKRQQAIKLADDFLRSVFLDMFGDPVTNPKGWEVIRLGNVVQSQLGKMLSQKAKVGNSPKKYLRNANVRWRQFNLDDLLKMDFDSREMEKFKLKNGDILVCEGGDVGRCSIWRDNVADCYYQKALHRVRPDLRVLTPEYVQEYFYWMSKRGGLSDSVSEVTFSHLTAEKLKELKIPIPPIALQNQFSVLYKNFESLVSKNESVLQVNDENFNSMSQKAFSEYL